MITAIVLSILFILGDCGVLFLSQKSFGRLPEGERLERIVKSPNYDGKQFVNLEPNDIVCDSLNPGEELDGYEAQGKRQSMWDRE